MSAPITALWAGLLGILSLLLAMNVVRARTSEKVIFGDGGVLVMQQRIRVHGNFIEYVPLALVLLLVGTLLPWAVLLAILVLIWRALPWRPRWRKPLPPAYSEGQSVNEPVPSP